MINHERALDLAATAIDFSLSAQDRLALEAHLAACRACGTEAVAMRRDAGRLKALPPVRPPAWVALAIGRRRRTVAPILAVAALVISGSLAAALAGSLIREPARVEATPPPAPRADRTPLAYPSVLLNTAVRVTAAEVVLRQLPSSAGAPIGSASRDWVLVTDGALRVRADGYDWYHATIVSEVSTLPSLPSSLRETDQQSGWIATRSETEAFVEPLQPRCPTHTGLEEVASMLEAERLACFGGATIEVAGVFTCPSCDAAVEGVYEPAWLADRSSAALIPQLGSPASLPLHFPPTGPEVPSEGGDIVVRGHLDDGAAAGCRLSLPMPGDPGASISPIDSESLLLLCRQAFVIESYEVAARE